MRTLALRKGITVDHSNEQAGAPDEPARRFVRVDLPGGVEGLQQLRHEAAKRMALPLADLFTASISEAIISAYVMGYAEAMEGIPSAVPIVESSIRHSDE